MVDKELRESIEALNKFDHGDDSDVEVQKVSLEVPRTLPSDIKELRKRENLTQQSLAAFLGVSIRTVQGWEIGKSKPNGPARRLIQLLAKNPDLINAINVSG